MNNIPVIIECPPSFTYLSESNKCYRLETDRLEWEVARLRCKGLHPKAHSVVINDARENRAIATFIAWKYGGFLIRKQGNIFENKSGYHRGFNVWCFDDWTIVNVWGRFLTEIAEKNLENFSFFNSWFFKSGIFLKWNKISLNDFDEQKSFQQTFIYSFGDFSKYTNAWVGDIE